MIFKRVSQILTESDDQELTVQAVPGMEVDTSDKEKKEVIEGSTEEIEYFLDKFAAAALPKKDAFAKKWNAWNEKTSEIRKDYEELKEIYEDAVADYEKELQEYKNANKETRYKLLRETDPEKVRALRAEMPPKPELPPKPQKPDIPPEPQERSFVGNLLFEGGLGIGKTSIITHWCKHNSSGRSLGYVIMKATDLDKDDFQISIFDSKTGNLQKRGTTDYDYLDDPNHPGILIIDEFNRANDRTLNSFLNLISGHAIYTADNDSKEKVLKGLLFVVACQNPYDQEVYGGTHKLDAATSQRFGKFKLVASKKKTLEYYEEIYAPDPDNTEEECVYNQIRLDIARKLLAPGETRFHFTSVAEHKKLVQEWEVMDTDDMAVDEIWNEQITTPRNLTQALESCTDKTSFLILWNKYCNNLDIQNIRDILEDYHDSEDDARNKVFKYLKDHIGYNPFRPEEKEAQKPEEQPNEQSEEDPFADVEDPGSSGGNRRNLGDKLGAYIKAHNIKPGK